MNESRDQERIQKAIGSTLSGLKGDPFLHTRVAALAARDEKGEKKMKNMKVALILALAAVLCLGTVAVASGVFSGSSDWDGNIVAEDVLTPMPTVPPAPTHMTVQQERDMQIAQFEARHEPGNGEMTATYDLETRRFRMNLVRCYAADEADFRALVAGTGLVLPEGVPEGYVFSQGAVYYGCTPGGEYRLVDYADSGMGFVLGTYTLDAEDMVAIEYVAVYERPDQPGSLPLQVRAMMVESAEEIGIGIWGEQTVTPVSIPGMEKALCRSDASGATLVMYAQLSEMVPYATFNNQGLVGLTQLYISVSGPVTGEELVAMFGGK